VRKANSSSLGLKFVAVGLVEVLRSLTSQSAACHNDGANRYSDEGRRPACRG